MGVWSPSLTLLLTAEPLHLGRPVTPGPPGQHRGGHTLSGGRPSQQPGPAAQLRKGVQRAPQDLELLPGRGGRLPLQAVPGASQAPDSLHSASVPLVSSPPAQNEAIVNRGTGRCLEVIPANVNFGHLLVLQVCTGQRWSIKNTMKQPQ